MPPYFYNFTLFPIILQVFLVYDFYTDYSVFISIPRFTPHNAFTPPKALLAGKIRAISAQTAPLKRACFSVIIEK
jgi:hypothetical protein